MRSVSSLLFGAILAVHLLLSSEGIKFFKLFKRKGKKGQEKEAFQTTVNELLEPQPRNVENIVQGLIGAGIKTVVVVSNPSDDLTVLLNTVKNRKKKLKVVQLDPRNRLESQLKKIEDRKTWIIDFDHQRLRDSSHSNPVAWGTREFTFEHLQKFIRTPLSDNIPEKDKITQEKLNSLVKEKRGTLTAQELVDVCIKGGVLVFVFKWEHTVAGLQKGVKPEVKPDFLDVVKEIAKRELPFYIITRSDSRTLKQVLHLSKGEKPQFWVGADEKAESWAGSASIWQMLNEQHVKPTAIFAFDREWHEKVGNIHRVTFAEAVEDEQQIGELTLHLKQVEQHSGLPPGRIVYFDSNYQTVQKAVAHGHLALHVNNQLREEGESTGFAMKRLDPVERLVKYPRPTEESLRKEKQDSQMKVNKLLEQPGDADSIAKGLQAANIKAVVVFSDPSDDLDKFQDAAKRVSMGRMGFVQVPPGNPLPNVFNKLKNFQVLIINFDRQQLRPFSHSHPVALGTRNFSFEHLQPFK